MNGFSAPAMPDDVASKAANLPLCKHGSLKVAMCKRGVNEGKWFAVCPCERDDPTKCGRGSPGQFQWLSEGGQKTGEWKRQRTENGSTFSGGGLAQPDEVLAALKELKGALEDQRVMLEQLLQRTAGTE